MKFLLLRGCMFLLLTGGGRAAEQIEYAIKTLASSEVVNLRDAPGLNSNVFGGIAEYTRNLRIIGNPVMRDGKEWVQIQSCEIKGWIDKGYVAPSAEVHLVEKPNEARAEGDDFRLYSPSGRIILRLVGRSGLSLYVMRDGAKTKEYGVWGSDWGGMPKVYFSQDERFFALATGGPSWGTDIYAFMRGANGEFSQMPQAPGNEYATGAEESEKGKAKRKKPEHEQISMRCWKQILASGLIPREATIAHLRARVEGVEGSTFRLAMGGNYMSHGQINFGPIPFDWDAATDVLTLKQPKPKKVSVP